MNQEEDVIDGSSPQEETNEQQPAESTQPEETQEAAPQQAKEDNTPFHMHPRFQEVISQKNQLAEQNKTFERQLQDLQRQLQALNKPEAPKANPIRERLTGIDKEFAEYVGSVEKIPELEKQLQDFQEWRQQQAAQANQQAAVSTKEKFYSENKVPAEHREIYDAQIVAIANSNPKLQVSDLPQVMKGIHEKMTKLFQSTQRDATKQLVDAKKVSAAKPSTQPKGLPASSVKKSAPASKADLRAEMIASVLGEVKAAKETI
jgi:hypothetical protein